MYKFPLSAKLPSVCKDWNKIEKKVAVCQLVMELGGNQQAGEHCVQNTDMDSMSMDTNDWLESLLPSDNQNGNMTNQHTSQESELSGYDPLLATVQDPFDPFSLEEFRSTADLTAALSWDKVDFAA
ncbi:hypothetical protein FQR65_LT03827 [Abscondita terminalis]|nr:hypothetical protein FQR65_LT03827 [Abscondita terminalis]